jgi:hypothetical protein
MKPLNFAQMENLTAGDFDCSVGGQLAFIAGTAAGGTLFGGAFGFLGGLGGGLLYSVYKCYK